MKTKKIIHVSEIDAPTVTSREVFVTDFNLDSSNPLELMTGVFTGLRDKIKDRIMNQPPTNRLSKDIIDGTMLIESKVWHNWWEWFDMGSMTKEALKEEMDVFFLGLQANQMNDSIEKTKQEIRKTQDEIDEMKKS